MAWRRRTTGNSRKESSGTRETLEHVRRDDRSPKQVAGVHEEGRQVPMSHGLTCRYVRADGSRKLAGHCRHGMKYDRHGRPNRTAKVRNILGRTGIHDRSDEVDGRRFGNRETDTTTGRNGKGAILTLTETIGQLHSHGETRGRNLNCVIVLFFLLVSKISFYIKLIFKYLSESKIMVYLID